jgi:antitoxin ParD1/3/4
MPANHSLNVSLTPELDQFVRNRVESGRYATSSEVIREGLRLLEQREQEREAALERVRKEIRRGAEQADRGEFVDPKLVREQALAIVNRRQGKSS